MSSIEFFGDFDAIAPAGVTQSLLELIQAPLRSDRSSSFDGSGRAQPKAVRVAPPREKPRVRKQPLRSSTRSQARRYDIPSARPPRQIEPVSRIASRRRTFPGPQSTVSTKINTKRQSIRTHSAPRQGGSDCHARSRRRYPLSSSGSSGVVIFDISTSAEKRLRSADEGTLHPSLYLIGYSECRTV
jgi:hypothetical protein